MEQNYITARSDLEQMLVDETVEPKALQLSLLEDITGDFSADQEIGRGGFAVVYKGILGDRAVAVKRLNTFTDEKEFDQEIECLMRVKHKNVVRFLGYCDDRKRIRELFNGKFVMADAQQRLLCFDYITKGSLDKYIKDTDREWRICYKIIKGICEGLEYLHENHIIHLDLKPANILLDDNMVPKITDFGLSRCFDENQSRHITKTISGTMGYLPPEWLEAGVITRSTDLYSLGVILIEILTGQKGHKAIEDVLASWSDRLEISQGDTQWEQIRVCYETALKCKDLNPMKRPASARDIIARLHKMESIQTAEAAASSEPSPFSSVSASSEPRHATLHAMRAPDPPPGQTVVMLPGSAYRLIETKPRLPARLGRRAAMAATKIASTYDMVEAMSYLYVSVVKARDLPTMDITGALDPYVEVKLGNFKGVTQHLEKTHNPVSRQTFAFSDAHLQSNQLEVIVKGKNTIRDDFIGRVVFDLSDIPRRLPPDSPLPSQWYTLSGAYGHSLGEIMLAVWFGSQADEAFPEAWHSEAHSLWPEALTNRRSQSQVYYSPKLIYLNVSVISAVDLIAAEMGRPLAPAIAKIQMGSQIQQTRPGKPQGSGSANQEWNEEFMFVASEPFEDPLMVTVEEKVATGRDEPVGRVIIPVASPHVPCNDLATSVRAKWFSLSRGTSVDEAAADVTASMTFASKIHLKTSLETAYHVSDELTHYNRNLQPSARKLWKSAIGVLEVGILSARGLGDNKYPYCVAKYGAKWVRTRTLLGTAAPQWNEPYTWEVFDLRTVITVAVFDDNHLSDHGNGSTKDKRIGKVRVWLATLESNRVYTHYYPLMALSPRGLKKTGELHLAVRFRCTAWANMLARYWWPLLPKMHYTNPISVRQPDYLRLQAVQMVAKGLELQEPPLHREVVEYMLDVDSHMCSLRRSKADFYRITSFFSGIVVVGKWFNSICEWKNPLWAVLVRVMFLILVCIPDIILPVVFTYLFMIGVWNYGRRPRRPQQMVTVLSHAEQAHLDELDLEFDTLPTSKPDDIVRLRYERSIAEMVQTVVGDLATHGERAESLLRWGDPRVTPVFITLLLVLAVVLNLTPFRVVAMVVGLYCLRPPLLRGK